MPMNKYLPVFICLVLALILLLVNIGTPKTRHINTYPNLPAPIGDEKILITSAGQAPEGTILQSITDNLNLDADYRPRALFSDLYDYKSVVIVLGFSANGLSHTPRSYQDELTRIDKLVAEADKEKLPIILVNLSGVLRENNRTWKLFTHAVPHADYYIGMDNIKNKHRLLTTLRSHHVPTTLVAQIHEIQIPFNSAFR